MQHIGAQPASLLRRFAAAIYDGLLVFALLMLVSLLMIVARGGAPTRPGNLLVQVALIATTAAFFVGFWTRGGQTLGMNAWRLRVEMQTGTSLTVGTAILRFVTALVSLGCFGLGFLWQLVDRRSLTWHDRIAGTHVILVPKRSPAANEAPDQQLSNARQGEQRRQHQRQGR